MRTPIRLLAGALCCLFVSACEDSWWHDHDSSSSAPAPATVTVSPTTLAAAGGTVTVTAIYAGSESLPTAVTARATLGGVTRTMALTGSGSSWTGTLVVDANASGSGDAAQWTISAGAGDAVTAAADAVTVAAPELPPGPPVL